MCSGRTTWHRGNRKASKCKHRVGNLKVPMPVDGIQEYSLLSQAQASFLVLSRVSDEMQCPCVQREGEDNEFSSKLLFSGLPVHLR